MRETMENPECMISICICTYNHEKYIGMMLDSILSQKTTYSYEIIVGDDVSQDHTPQVLTEYARKYKDRIKVILRKKNLGATKNAYHLFTKAKGKYLAILDGDDYWCDELKLQSQIDFLETHPEYSACSHWCTVVNDDNVPIKEKNELIEGVFWHYPNEVYGIEDFEKGYYSGQLSSTIFRNFILNSNIDMSILYRAHPMIGDRTMQLIAASQGDIYVMHKRMSCYRYIESKSASNWQSKARQKNLRGDEFAYICILEKYARKKLQINLDMTSVKKEKIICAAIYLLFHKDKENYKVLCDMIRCSGEKIKYGSIAVRAIIIKWYYKNIIKCDKKVQL